MLVWKWEILALVTAIGLLVATFVTLRAYDDNEYSDWPYSINLNTLLAIYTTILRALLLIPIAQGEMNHPPGCPMPSADPCHPRISVISQEKWNWFLRPQPLHHLESFDLASRGAWGSARLFALANNP